MKNGLNNTNYQIFYAILFLLPTILILLSFSYLPTFSAIYFSFTEWDGFFNPKFIGLKNYIQLINDPIFWKSLKNVLYWGLGSGIVTMIAPFICAELIISCKNKKSQYFFRSAFVLPMVVPTIVILQIWQFIYSPEIGLLNQLLVNLDLGDLGKNWLGDPTWVVPSLIFMGFPWISGLNLLLFYAGLQGIPGDVKEYAKIDGCVGLKRISKIDIPLIRGQIRLVLILTLIGVLQNTTTPLLMTNGGPGYSSYVPGLYMYFKAFKESKFGYASAIATIMFLLILIFTFIANKISKEKE
ncbi:MAG: carbohydrate ABC transporter permease [Lachnospirales bacterium]